MKMFNLPDTSSRDIPRKFTPCFKKKKLLVIICSVHFLMQLCGVCLTSVN